MPYHQLDRDQLFIRKLAERKNQIYVERDFVSCLQVPRKRSLKGDQIVEQVCEKIKRAKNQNKSVMLTFGDNMIKNGLSPLLINLMEEGWLTHLATNGGGVICDWEFAFQGKAGEDVRENVRLGKFGIWEETGFFMNLALIVGAYEGLGFGEALGKMIFNEGLEIPEEAHLIKESSELGGKNYEKAAAAIDLAGTIRKFALNPGFLSVPHPFKRYSVLAKAHEMKVPFTCHPMMGHDTLFNHPMNHGAAVGRTAQNDFLAFADSVRNLENGVYMSVGSAVMSPMIFEKCLSMSQNLEIQQGRHIDIHYMLIVDLAKSDWDWQKNGEPPMDNPAYYLRYCKTFSRMGGEMHYLSADNRDFMLELYKKLLY